ncbi:MAG: hypothetical protein OWQ48_00225 [Desulfurococcus sp.]|nr:hypothetical protein [Desulfurococcus sp.]
MPGELAVLIPSYDRSEILELTLPRWLESRHVSRVIVVAQASATDILSKYRLVLEKFNNDSRLVYTLKLGRLGSVRARNLLIEIALNLEDSYRYALMADDDLLPIESSLSFLVKDFDIDSEIGAVGGRVINARRQAVDPDFYLNTPISLADQLTRMIGYIFLDVRNGPRYAEFLRQFYAVRRELLNKIRYDELFDTPTGFREESDVHQQIKRLGYKLLMDPRVVAVHLAVEHGGNRPRMTMRERMYWKAHNHTIFIFKWSESTLKRVWYTLMSTMLLTLYKPWSLPWILKGLKDGVISYNLAQWSRQ